MQGFANSSLNYNLQNEQLLICEQQVWIMSVVYFHQRLGINIFNNKKQKKMQLFFWE